MAPVNKEYFTVVKNTNFSFNKTQRRIKLFIAISGFSEVLVAASN
jgi:hypothetical protein